MQVARVLGDEADTVSDLPAACLYGLAAKSIPDEVREEVLHQIASGEVRPNHELASRLKSARLDARVVGQAEAASDELAGSYGELAPSPASRARQAAQFLVLRVERHDLEELYLLLEDENPHVLRSALPMRRRES